MTDTFPAACSIAFKEWSGICRALRDGRQTILLRKGGIAEVGGTFSPEHDVFWLYPTYVHQQTDGLKSGNPADEDVPPTGQNSADTLVIVKDALWIDNMQIISRLDSFHDWNEASIAKKFHYRQPGLWVLVVRAFRGAAQAFALRPEYEGCQTWVRLDSPIATHGFAPSIEPAAYEALRMSIQEICGQKVPKG